ncbi:MAG TPA: quinol:electron acceptor oxidoreductase subunit ActD, partial [Desulfuromonadaceae bacterium]
MEMLGIFRDVESAAKAVAGLVREGFSEEHITSLTSCPYPEGVLVKTGKRSWFRWFTLACGFAGAATGFLLAAGTAWLYPVKTGDKPIIAFYPTGIVTYELTMLFFLVGTIVGMFLEMGLPPWRNRIYDPAIGDGCIGISITLYGGGETVRCGRVAPEQECIGQSASLTLDEQKTVVEKIMNEAGVLRIVTEA